MKPADSANQLLTPDEFFFNSKIRESAFPCLGAKASVGSRQVQYINFGYPTTDAIRQLANHLERFTERRSNPPSAYAVFAAVFTGLRIAAELEFETFLWNTLQRLHGLDRIPWDARYSYDPKDVSFKFSFAGHAYYVVGLHPEASRHARKFQHPTLVFNPVWQFERLRAANHLDGMIEKIRRRDREYQGSVNPNLQFEGVLSDAIQYSGRSVDESWICPFRYLDER